MLGEFLPELVHLDTFLTDKFSAVAAETKSWCFLAFLALRFFRLLEGVSDVKEMADVEGGLQGSDTVYWEAGYLPTFRASNRRSVLTSRDDSLETVLAEDMKAREQFGFGVRLQADCTVESVFDLL